MSTIQYSDEQIIAEYVNHNQNDYKAIVEGGKIWIESKGVRVQLYLKSVGYKGSYDITFSTYRHSESVNRVTKGSDTKVSMKKFKEHARYYIDQALLQQIISPAKVKSQSRTKKTFEDWKKDNADLIKHPSIINTKLKSYGTEIVTIDIDEIETTISTNDKIPNIRQLMGIIIQSGMKDIHVKYSDFVITANGEETTKFLKLLNSPLEWV